MTIPITLGCPIAPAYLIRLSSATKKVFALEGQRLSSVATEWTILQSMKHVTVRKGNHLIIVLTNAAILFNRIMYRENVTMKSATLSTDCERG